MRKFLIDFGVGIFLPLFAGVTLLTIIVLSFNHKRSFDRKQALEQRAEAANIASNPDNVRTIIGDSNIVDYGQGVFYFPYVKAEFGNNLSAFLKNHPNLEVASIAPDSIHVNGFDGDWSATVGYFVTFRENK